jgi:hypothetical protein
MAEAERHISRCSFLRPSRAFGARGHPFRPDAFAMTDGRLQRAVVVGAGIGSRRPAMWPRYLVLPLFKRLGARSPSRSYGCRLAWEERTGHA